MAEGRGKAHADELRKMRTKTMARKLVNGKEVSVPGNELKIGERFVCETGDFIPADGEIIEGIATVDESAITGESAPVVRESGGDRSAVTGGTRVISDRIVVQRYRRGGQFVSGQDDQHDRRGAPPKNAQRNRAQHRAGQPDGAVHPGRLYPAALCPLQRIPGRPNRTPFSLPPRCLLALVVCLIPTTIGGLLSAIGIAGIDRLMRRNVLATSGRAVEAAGDVDVLLLDKTGTITLGNRMATEFIPAPGVKLKSWPTPRKWLPWPMKPRKAAPSPSWPRRNTACAAAKSPRPTPNLFPSPPKPG